MKTLVAACVALAVAGSASPARAYVVEVLTSITIADSEDETKLEERLQAAINDVLRQAIAFTPTVIVLADARVVRDRLYVLLVIADQEGEEMIAKLSAEPTASSTPPRPR
jgi:hypothetical protein